MGWKLGAELVSHVTRARLQPTAVRWRALKISGLNSAMGAAYIFYEVNFCVILIHYPKYDLHPPSNSPLDVRQNHWTMKHRSPLTHYPSMTFIHQKVFKILGNITQPWNIGHSDLHLCPHDTKVWVILMTDVWPKCHAPVICNHCPKGIGGILTFLYAKPRQHYYDRHYGDILIIDFMLREWHKTNLPWGPHIFLIKSLAEALLKPCG